MKRLTTFCSLLGTALLFVGVQQTHGWEPGDMRTATQTGWDSGTAANTLAGNFVFTFANNLTSVGSPGGPDAPTITPDCAPSPGPIDAASTGIGLNANQYTLALLFPERIDAPNNPWCNALVMTATLHNVNDAVGNHSNAVSVSFGLLIGDVNGTDVVSNADVSAVKAQVGSQADQTNFRRDVTANGVISNTDVVETKAKAGTALPP